MQDRCGLYVAYLLVCLCGFVYTMSRIWTTPMQASFATIYLK